MSGQTAVKFKVSTMGLHPHANQIFIRIVKLTVVCASIFLLYYTFSHGLHERLQIIIRNPYVKNAKTSVNQEHLNIQQPNEVESTVIRKEEQTFSNVKQSNIVESTVLKKEEQTISDLHQSNLVEDVVPIQVEPTIKKFSVQIKNERVYIYSAIVHFANETNVSKVKHVQKVDKPADLIVLNSWRHISFKGNLKCCYMYKDKMIASAELHSQHTYFIESILVDVQYRCPLIADEQIIGVSLANVRASCPDGVKYYISPVVIKKEENKTIGVCTKISYGTIKPGKLVEWFEAMRFLGVDKIISYNFNLSPETQKIFNYYGSIGLVDSYPFEVPETDRYPRKMGEKVDQAWTDEQIVVNDCRLRLGAFKYAVFLDKDEILLPKKLSLQNSLRTYFETLDGHIVGQAFSTEIHITDWGPSNKEHPLFIGQYRVGSIPTHNSVKYMFKPPYFKLAGCLAHNCYMFDDKTSVKSNFAPEDKITVHHFRSCDLDRRLFVNGTFCRETHRSSSKQIGKLADKLIKPVSDILNNLNPA